MSRLAMAVLITATVPALASAQPSQGPMTIERVQSGWLGAPDFKITDVDGHTSELLGGYAGWIVDNTIFVGGGGYWMPDTSEGRHLAYGGLVVQWFTRTDAPLGLSFKGLVGGGEGTLSRTFNEVVRVPNGRGFSGRFDANHLPQSGARVWWDQGFFVAEPQVDALIRLTKHTRLTVGAGYRFVVADVGGDSLRGPVGTLGLQIGGGGS